MAVQDPNAGVTGRIEAARRDAKLLDYAINIAAMLKGLTCAELKVVEGKVRMMLGVSSVMEFQPDWPTPPAPATPSTPPDEEDIPF